jgi:hypothetical protein
MDGEFMAEPGKYPVCDFNSPEDAPLGSTEGDNEGKGTPMCAVDGVNHKAAKAALSVQYPPVFQLGNGMFRGYAAYLVLLAEAFFRTYRVVIPKVLGFYQVFYIVCNNLVKGRLFYGQKILLMPNNALIFPSYIISPENNFFFKVLVQICWPSFDNS